MSYWDSVLARRISRRRGLAILGGGAAGAAFLAACGGDDQADEEGLRDSSGLLAPVEDTSDQAKKGGTLTLSYVRDPLHFDGQAQGQIQLNIFHSLAYSALVRNKPGYQEPSTFSEVEPELAESWEVSPDKLSVTFKLRRGVKWHNKPPINGRAFDSSDVVASWKRYETSSTPNNKSSNFNSVNPSAPIVGYEAPDANTVVLRLNEPANYIMQRLTSMITGEVGGVYPRESDQGFEPRTGQIGTGPYVLDSFSPSTEINYRRNPEYFDQKWGHFDEIRFPLIGEYAAGLAQLKAGALSTYTVQQPDVLPTKREIQALAMYAGTPSAANPLWHVRFGWNPIGGKPSPFKDMRVRQAVSMAFDRETYIDTFGNVTPFRDQGLPIETYWYTSMGYVPEWTLDPRASDFGSNAKYYQYNAEEAKKLLQAAESGYDGSFPEIPSGRVTAVFGATYTQLVDVMEQWLRDINLKISSKPLDYNLEYLPNYVTKQGQFEGILFGSGATTSTDVVDYYVWRFYSKSGATSGSLGMGGPGPADAEVDRFIDRAKAEFDTAKRREVIHDLQRHLAEKAYAVIHPGIADTLSLLWPAIRNVDTYQGDSRAALPGLSILPLWFDNTKAHR